jgi:hypothetical protein
METDRTKRYVGRTDKATKRNLSERGVKIRSKEEQNAKPME